MIQTNQKHLLSNEKLFSKNDQMFSAMHGELVSITHGLME